MVYTDDIILVCILDQLHVLLVPLLDVVQQHLVLVPVQLQTPHLDAHTLFIYI